MAQPSAEDSSLNPKRSRMETRQALSFLDEDKAGTL